ncbi:alpha-related fimbriae usher protein [Candidatus Hamiltonella defensa]|nr:TcfC E-set like domain-containing protein [Candidatus Hamiltonella defensa]MBK4360784.1 alpha-related fimbriae usher protein [Candidatus Hamiltonella defensa]
MNSYNKKNREKNKKILYIKKALYIFLLFIFSEHTKSEIKIEYLVTKGFSPFEQEMNMEFLGILNGEILPGKFYFSKASQKLIFDKKQFQENGLNDSTIKILEKVLFQLPYHKCAQGCETLLMGYRVIFDKLNQSLSITHHQKTVMPETTWGLVHNQSFDISAASNHYRALSAEGQGYFGLPGQSFGYINWFYHQWHRKNHADSHQGFGSWYLQKNFPKTYLRFGQKNNLDASAGSIQTLTNPWLDQFMTFGSQHYLSHQIDSEDSLVLYASSPGHYEIYRDNRLIRQIPAQIGRNSISYNQLPSGYYSADVRLVDNTGREITKEKVTISNIDYQAAKGWFVTLGKTKKQKSLVQLSLSQPKFGFQFNGTVLGDDHHQWAAEGNISRSTQMNGMKINTTLGVMGGEKGFGHYARLNVGNSVIGYISLSYYQHPYISVYAPRQQSQYVSYSRHLGDVQITYHWQGSSKQSQHQIQSYWQWNCQKFNMSLAVGVEKSRSNKRSAGQAGNHISFFINTVLTLTQSHANIDIGYRDREWMLSAHYQKEIEHAYGKSTFGITGTQLGKRPNFSGYVEHHGTRGNSSLSAGIDDKIYHARFHYDGMFAMNRSGIAFGQRSTSGVALLVKAPSVPDTPYRLKVEGSPIWGGHLYAIPISKYRDALFARAQNENTDMDMDIQLPVRITRAHPGQVFSAEAKVRLSLLYNGFLIDEQKKPISGTIKETGDLVYPNGLFSIHSDVFLKDLQVQSHEFDYLCNLKTHTEHYYQCQKTTNHKENL